jgi:hypothetical protein
MASVDYSLYTTTITSGSYPIVKVKTRKRIVQVLVRFRQSVIVLAAAVFPVQACKATDNRFRALAPLASWVPDPGSLALFNSPRRPWETLLAFPFAQHDSSADNGLPTAQNKWTGILRFSVSSVARLQKNVAEPPPRMTQREQNPALFTGLRPRNWLIPIR